MGPVEKSARLEASSSSTPIRRSARKGRIHDEIKFEVSSDLTLKDLKLKVNLNHFYLAYVVSLASCFAKLLEINVMIYFTYVLMIKIF